MTKKILVMTSLAGLLACGAAVAAQMPRSGSCGWENLNLNKSQVEQLQKLRYQHQERMIDLRADLKKKMLALKEQMTSSQTSEKTVDNAIDAVSAARSRMMKERFRHMMEVKSVLTPEQWKQFRKDMAQRRMHRRREGRGPRRGMRPGGSGMGPGMMGCPRTGVNPPPAPPTN
ncbi:MAG: Spy/CpxP family protein refolding chaperone [Acidobacteriota bacterium]